MNCSLLGDRQLQLSTQPTQISVQLAIATIKNTSIPVPKLDLQQSVARLTGNLDVKIPELNNCTH
ncbi:MAG TPA: hypothetical protein DCY88_10925 [Cyanobacteria bacterium UBA11372]|nr:hypothetical protein [Cyanobacteria bacterium UBA11372]